MKSWTALDLFDADARDAPARSGIVSIAPMDRDTRGGLVLHDWGTTLGFNWARLHPERVAGIAFMEPLLREMTWDDFPESARALFQAFRTPGSGEKLIMEDNVFIEQLLPSMIMRKLSTEEMNAYRAPFPTPADRKPV